MGLLDSTLREVASDVIGLLTDTPLTIRRTVDTYDLTTGTPNLGATTTAFTRASGSFITDGFLVGGKVASIGFSNAGNNGTFTVTVVAALALTVSVALVTESQGTGKSLKRVTDYNLKASPPIEYTLSEINGTTIQRGDFKVYVAAKDIAIELQPETDTVLRGGLVYRVVYVKPIISGDQVALFELQCRR